MPMTPFQQDVATAGIQTAFNMLGQGVNNLTSWGMGNWAREQNYLYNEKAAHHADVRARAFYNDFNSPSALLRQFKEAGLSPSLMFGGGGQGGATPQAAQGEGASGINPGVFGINPVDYSQIKLANAQARNIEADTEQKRVNTDIAQIERDCKEIDKALKIGEFDFFRSYFEEDDGTRKSIMDIAAESKNFNTFMKTLREKAEISNNGDLSYLLFTSQGFKICKDYYEEYQRFGRDVKVLKAEGNEAELASKVAALLSNSEFAELSVNEQIEQLRAIQEQAKMTKRQQKAWNDLLDKCGKEGGTAQTLLIVLGMFMNNALSNWNHGISVRKTNNTYNFNH